MAVRAKFLSFLLLTPWLLALHLLSPAAGAAELRAIRMGVHQDYTRIVVDLTGAVTWKTETAADGAIRLQLRGGDTGRLMSLPHTHFAGVGLVEDAVMQADEEGNGVVALDTADHVALERVFLLPAENGRPWRLVIDVARNAEDLPREAAARPAPPAAPQAISEPAMPAQAAAAIADDMPGSLNAIASAAGSNGPKIRFSGNVEAESRTFTQKSNDGVGWRQDGSIAAAPELKMVFNNNMTSLTAAPFARLDGQDNHRTHADLREFKIVHKTGNLKITLGFDRVFWGVAESVHQVNILNQTDMIEDIDGETKLGQPMVAAAQTTPFGTFSIYVMPYFHERTFPGAWGRPRGPLTVDDALTRYESRDKEWHPDIAARWNDTIGPVDVGLAYFSGTNRQPLLIPALNAAGAPVLAPYYELIDQASWDAQTTLGSWLLKTEGYVRWGQTDPALNRRRPFAAATTGFEYTFPQVHKSSWDVGLVAEYSFDTRGRQAWENVFQNDLFLGVRLTPNDEHDTEILAGSFVDLDNGGWLAKIKASRRIGANWKLSVDARLPNHARNPMDPMHFLADDDFVQIRLGYFF